MDISTAGSGRGRYNPKRKLHKGLAGDRAESLARSVRYKGSPLHKRSPGDFGLTPPASPRPGKTLCDGVGIFAIKEATRLLRQGAEGGLVSNDADQGFPRYIWMVINDLEVLEARCDDPNNGTYHGYPLERNDPMTDMIIKQWRER
jgi:hypothetical protein